MCGALFSSTSRLYATRSNCLIVISFRSPLLSKQPISSFLKPMNMTCQKHLKVPPWSKMCLGKWGVPPVDPFWANSVAFTNFKWPKSVFVFPFHPLVGSKILAQGTISKVLWSAQWRQFSFGTLLFWLSISWFLRALFSQDQIVIPNGIHVQDTQVMLRSS